MAATLVTAIKNYIGTAAERVALSTTGLAAGSTFYESDGFLQVYNGTAWIPSILPTRVPRGQAAFPFFSHPRRCIFRQR